MGAPVRRRRRSVARSSAPGDCDARPGELHAGHAPARGAGDDAPHAHRVDDRRRCRPPAARRFHAARRAGTRGVARDRPRHAGRRGHVAPDLDAPAAGAGIRSGAADGAREHPARAARGGRPARRGGFGVAPFLALARRDRRGSRGDPCGPGRGRDDCRRGADPRAARTAPRRGHRLGRDHGARDGAERPGDRPARGAHRRGRRAGRGQRVLDRARERGARRADARDRPGQRDHLRGRRRPRGAAGRPRARGRRRQSGARRVRVPALPGRGHGGEPEVVPLGDRMARAFRANGWTRRSRKPS